MSYSGPVFLVSMIYLSFVVAFVYSLLELGFSRDLSGKTFRRWGKLLLLLVGLGAGIWILTLVQEALR